MSFYPTWHNQVIHLTHYFFAYGLLAVLIPRFIFTPWRGDRMEQAFINYCKMTLLLIVLGYLLVILKLFEMITILLILGLLSVRTYLRRRSVAITDEHEKYYVQTAFYNWLDGQLPVKPAIIAWARESFAAFKREAASSLRWPALIRWPLLAMVIAVAAYLRFYDAVTSSPPAMSDGYVTLAWMKYINGRELFHDGIYPQGFHIVLATISKFAMMDHLYILKYTGPLNGVLIVLGLYFTLSRITGRYAAGLLSAMVFGWAGFVFSQNGWERQAATNSQEFAFVFFYPALYFAFRYLSFGKHRDLRHAAICLAVCGLVHSLVYAFTVMSVALMMIVFLLTDVRGVWKSCRKLFTAGIVTALAAVLPLGIGLIMGRQVHSSSANYLVSQVTDITIPELHLVDYCAVAAILLVGAMALIYAVRGQRQDARFGLFVFLFGGTAFVLYTWVGYWTESELIASRSTELWTLSASFGIGAAWHLAARFTERWFRLRHLLDGSVCVLLAAFLLLAVQPAPIVTYKMERDSSVEQYLRISGMLRPKTWTIVSQEEHYALVLGNGFHMYVRDLLQTYDPQEPFLTKRTESEPDPDLSNDIFIFREKEVFQVSRSNSIYPLLEDTYKRREKEMEELEKWLVIHRASQRDMTLFYEDDHLEVYRLHREMTREQMNRILWGDEGKGKE